MSDLNQTGKLIQNSVVFSGDGSLTTYTARSVTVPPCDHESYEGMAIIQQAGVLDFWDDPSEDVYSSDDESKD